MGLFSKLFKNKQESTAQDSGFYVPSEEQASTARTRSKRAVGGATPRRAGKDVPDPVLPEKKRARRRLVGAVALALAVAVGLPMILDSEPKPLATDIDIQIPSKDKPAVVADATPAPAPARVADSAALDQSEEIVSEPDKVKPAPLPARPAVVPAPAATPAPVVTAAPVVAELKPSEPVDKPRKLDIVEPSKAKPEVKHEPKPEVKPEVRHEPKPEVRHEPKSEPKSEPKTAEPKPVAKPVLADSAKPAPSSDDAARALAILEGKPAAAKPQESVSSKFVVQVAALGSQDKVDELQGKLRDAGISSYTQKTSNAAGERVIRVRVGPFGNREEADKARAKLQKLGLGGSVVPA
ncbi:SPOR domain-containing protein [Janthinobacterium agaricidamnosum]|uniref:Sporulation related domain protein n=1 Tax=Janthinobacterium agaricidamnosum NBRC 102515 = DSM 9628 TaxID=1349767 RepID=W0V9D1_9BURK|nr:SPOR domain-containing protein [Janthinobacterium agaricidamnosum]CDG84220.1 sporulation related domain protein [Janthinobacterium agaricidamnosum NBRC 102515 = DSM 9628]